MGYRDLPARPTKPEGGARHSHNWSCNLQLRPYLEAKFCLQEILHALGVVDAAIEIIATASAEAKKSTVSWED